MATKVKQTYALGGNVSITIKGDTITKVTTWETGVSGSTSRVVKKGSRIVLTDETASLPGAHLRRMPHKVSRPRVEKGASPVRPTK